MLRTSAGGLTGLAGLTLASTQMACSPSRQGTRAPEDSAAPAEPDIYADLRGFCDEITAVSELEYEERRERARRALAATGFDALVMEAGRHYSFFTGSRWGTSERPLIHVLPRTGASFWCAPAFEVPTLQGRVGDVPLVTWQENQSPYETLKSGLSARGLGGARLALDPEMRLFVAAGIQSALPSAQPGDACFEAVRIVKTEIELARMRRANEATKAALVVAAGLLQPGMTEPEFAGIVREAQLAAGLEDIWVLSLFGPNAAYPHGSERHRKACPGELILVDTGGSLHGYQSDITRTWALGPGQIGDDERRAFDTVLAAQNEAMKLIRPGVRCGEVDARAREVMDQAGYGPHYQRFTHRLGHGIGIQGHEAPYLVRDNPLILRKGMTMSNEPGIYAQGQFGIRIEDIVAVTDTNHEVFGPRVESLDAPFG